MGLLDDAIREHLDLKRRHGADPAEVERAEREALGPVRRAPESAAEDELPEAESYTPEDELSDERPYEDEPDGSEHESWTYDETVAGDEGGVYDEDTAEPESEPAAPLPHHAGSFDTDVPSSDPSRHGFADHTVEYNVEEALGAEPELEPREHRAPDEEEGEDVLEETPEFLQDTPDHDRLWFEQRPPRDFDFDK